MASLTKRQVIDRIQEYLEGELSDVQHASAAAGESQVAVQAELSGRRQELERLQALYRFMPVRDYGKDDVIIPSTLVSLQIDDGRGGGHEAFYFIAPQGGGLITQIDGKPLQVITPNSPLGEALLGRKLGDQVDVEIRGKIRRYKVTSLI